MGQELIVRLGDHILAGAHPARLRQKEHGHDRRIIPQLPRTTPLFHDMFEPIFLGLGQSRWKPFGPVQAQGAPILPPQAVGKAGKRRHRRGGIHLSRRQPPCDLTVVPTRQTIEGRDIAAGFGVAEGAVEAGPDLPVPFVEQDLVACPCICLANAFHACEPSGQVSNRVFKIGHAKSPTSARRHRPRQDAAPRRQAQRARRRRPR